MAHTLPGQESGRRGNILNNRMQRGIPWTERDVASHSAAVDWLQQTSLK